MLPTTLQAVRSILAADPSVNPPERNRLLSFMRRGPEAKAIPVAAAPESCLIRRAEAAHRLAVSVRCVDTWARKGILKKRILPGHARASGFLESAVSALIHGAEY
ncbi:MAG: hypothetical protein NT011_03120 [Kiritimatiellaeota bacterium]|nr:hypothetical protein [Kiritimatiellota bacterium]